MNDTIAAISTALGVGAISIVRISGENAISIASSIFKGDDLNEAETHTIHYGHIYDEKETIDEVLVTVMKAPKTFTMEDVIEINCHGGISSTNRILALVLSKGARLAEPGEFTKRAFLSGRIDLIEAEGIMDLINAKTDKSRKLALNQVSGEVSKKIKDLRSKIVDILTNIEVNIDYPEYEDILVVTNNMIKDRMKELHDSIKKILTLSENGKIIKEGISTLILGRPNVGKSSLLNNLLGEEKAIVTEIEGTTRDLVEGSINLDGILLNIIDTAGIRETEDIIEKIGVQKGLDLINSVDLIILVLNNNEKLNKDDLELIERTKNLKRVIFINKVDLENKLERSNIKDINIVEGSTIKADGVNKLKSKIKEMFNLEMIESSDFTYLSNANQIAILKSASDIIDDVYKGLEDNFPIDIIEIDLKRIWELLGDLIGESCSDELINELFKKFCIGK
jgi:tRNA modification GTPase